MSERAHRRLAAIVAADVAEFSRLVSEDEEATLGSLRNHRSELIDPLIAEFGGRIANTAGDSLLVEFSSVVDAVRCAVEIQKQMARRNANLTPNRKIMFRMGINLGDVVAEGDDLLGDGVNVAARLEGLANPGGICLSRAARDQVRDRLDLVLEDQGEIEVKNIARPVRVFRLQLDKQPSERKFDIPALPQAGWVRRHLWQLAVLLLICVVGFGGVLWWQFGKPISDTASIDRTALPSGKPSIAILPFNNLSVEKAQEYFADGLTDDLITDLSKISGLFVIARNSVFTFKGRAVRIEEVAEQLGVKYIVEGSVRRSRDRVRVNAQLVDGRTGRHIWAERYDRQLTDLFAVQDEIVSRIVSALAVTLTQAEATSLTHNPPAFEAYDLYLKAREGYFSRDQSRMRESLALYAKSLEIDPEFARAYAGYAQLSADIWRLSSLREAMSGANARKAAEEAARKALTLDPTLASAHGVLALIYMTEAKYDEAIEYAEQAVALDPNNADAHTERAIVLIYAGKPEAALDAIRTSLRLNPRPTPHQMNYYGLALFLNRHYEDAITVLESIVDTRDRGIADAPRELLAMAYAEAGRIEDAREQVASLRQSEIFLNWGYHRVVYSHHARKDDLQRRLDALKKAGMPEWPFDFKFDASQRLIGSEIEALIAAKTWSGMDKGRRSRFIQEFGKGESTVFASADTLLNGVAFVKGDELCERYVGFILGRDLCGPVLRKTNSADLGEYVYVNPMTLRVFALSSYR